MSLRKEASSTAKFKIEQKVPSCSKKRGPYVVDRDLNPNDLIIKRRFGEGAKPLFERDDISVNLEVSAVDKNNRDELRWASGKCAENGSNEIRFQSNASNSSNSIKTKTTSRAREKEISTSNLEKYSFKRSVRHSSEESIIPERNRKYLIRSSDSDRISQVNTEILQEPTDVDEPYLQNRGKNRTRRSSRNSSENSTSPDRFRKININASNPQPSSSKKSRRTQEEEIPYFSDPKREKERLRLKYGTPVPRKICRDSKSRSPPLSYFSNRRKSPKKKYETSFRDSRRRRSTSIERRYYPSRSSRRYNHHNEERKQNHDQRTAQLATPLATTQIITIPVPMPEYPYVFPTWTHSPAWGGPIPHTAPQHFTPYRLPPAVMPTIRTPFGLPRPHNFPMFRPQHRYHPQNFGPRLPKSNRHKN